MLFCAHLTIQVKHSPAPSEAALPPATKPLPGGAAPGPLLPAVPTPPLPPRLPPTQGSGRAAPGPRLQPPGAGGEAAPPAGCGPGRPLQPPGLQRGRGAGGGTAPRGPEPAMAEPERLGAVPVEIPGEGKSGEGSGHRAGAPGGAAVARGRGGRSEELWGGKWRRRPAERGPAGG